MWWTEEGERVLRGAEWELFRAGLEQVWDDVEESFNGEECFPTEIAAFDDLQPAQKLALLAHVGQALRDAAVPCPDLTAHTEATIAAVFEQIRHSVAFEIETKVDHSTQYVFFWRRLIRSACVETGITGEEPLPEVSCEDSEEWSFLVECLAAGILWDNDFTAGASFLDDDPQVNRARMAALGIADDYFLAVAPDPGPKELEDVRRALRDITGRQVLRNDR